MNPINGLKADIDGVYELAKKLGASTNSDFAGIADRLGKFAKNGQLSIFSGNWFDADEGTAFKLTPEADLLLTSHYLEALQMQSKASEISALLGGKMPHVMTLVPGGTAFVPTQQKLDDLKMLIKDLKEWIDATVIQDTLALVPFYGDVAKFGKGCGRYIAWGVFEGPEYPYEGDYVAQMANRYLPSGVIDENFKLTDPDESKIREYVGHSWYKGEATYQSPYFVTDAEYTGYYKEEGANDKNPGTIMDRYSWVKAPMYGEKPMEAGPFSRVLAAYLRNNHSIKGYVDAMLEATGLKLTDLQSTLGRVAVRQVETVYIAELMEQWCDELIEAIKGGDSSYWKEPLRTTGSGTGFWEAPRGALYHSEKVTDGKIDGYQIIIPSTWNLAPRNEHGEKGPLEQGLIGCPVETIEKPINALRTVHSFDPCTACAVHVTEPATGKHFETVTSPWGVK